MMTTTVEGFRTTNEPLDTTVFEADRTVNEVLQALNNRFDLEAVANAVATHQPGQPVDMSSFEHPVSGLTSNEWARPHFYQKYPGDKRGAVKHSALDALYVDATSPEDDRIVLDKREDTQDVGAFKVRGAAMAAFAYAERNPRVRTFTTGSAGNHLRGLVLAANTLNQALIASGEVRVDDNGDVVPEDLGLLYEVRAYCGRNINEVKLWHARNEGAKVFNFCENLEEGLGYAKRYADFHPDTAVFIHPFDDPEVMAGQATIGLELLFDLIDQGVDLLHDDITAYVPVGGGGLFSGLASVWAWAKQVGILNENARLVPAETDNCDAANRELTGQTRLGNMIDTTTDGLAVQTAGRNTLPVIAWYSNGVAVTPKPYLVRAEYELANAHPQAVPEFSGAVALAAALREMETDLELGIGRKVAVVLTTGSNVTPEVLKAVSAEFASHPEDPRVERAAAELGHVANVLAFRLASQRQLIEAAAYEARLAAEDEEADRSQPSTHPYGVAHALNGPTQRDYVVVPRRQLAAA